jgi:hypothetical protein
MPKPEEVNAVSEESSDFVVRSADPGGTRLRAYQRRMLLAGFAIVALSFLAGIFLSFYQWDRGSPFEPSSWRNFNPLGRATYGPLVFALVLFPITIPVALVLLVPIYIGIRKERLWPLPLLGFLSMGLMWLWFITELWKMD